MRRILPLALVTALAALPALAQAPQRQPGGFMRGGSTSGLLLNHKPVQQELQLSEDQIKKITDAGTKQKKAMEDLMKSEDRGAAFKKLFEMAEANEKEYASILNEQQNKRLKELSLQARGASAFLDVEVGKQLGITEEQREKLRNSQMEAFQQVAKLREGAASREELQKKMAEFNKANQDKMMAVLTAEQKAKWKTMTGEPFKGELPAMGAGFFGGRRPGK